MVQICKFIGFFFAAICLSWPLAFANLFYLAYMFTKKIIKLMRVLLKNRVKI